FLPDGERAVSAGADGILRVWDVGKGTEVSKVYTGVIEGALSGDGKKVLAYHGKHLELWDIELRKKIHATEMERDVHSVALAPKGNYALFSSGPFFLWDIEKWQAVQEFRAGVVERPIEKMGRMFSLVTGLGLPAAFSQDGKCAVLCKAEREKRWLARWDIEKG